MSDCTGVRKYSLNRKQWDGVPTTIQSPRVSDTTSLPPGSVLVSAVLVAVRIAVRIAATALAAGRPAVAGADRC